MILRAALGVILAMLMLGSVPPVEFEGVVESRNTTVDELGKQQQFVMTIWVKKGMLKIHNTAVGSTPAYTVIYRSDRKTIWTLNDDEQTYFEVLQSDMPQGGTGLSCHA